MVDGFAGITWIATGGGAGATAIWLCGSGCAQHAVNNLARQKQIAVYCMPLIIRQ